MTSFPSPDSLLRAEHYYGLVLSSQLLAASEEQLTDQAREDLFEAHLSTNYSYFGGIDKTLSGFFILSDEDDNYTLADVRDPQGGIYWQDHETREISLLFESLDDYIAYQQELAAQEEEERDSRQLRTQFAPRRTFAPSLHPSTPELAERYQWLVWLLGQMNRFQTDADLVSSGTSHFLHYWQTPDHALSTFEQELPLLRKDPHLAIYWLLHHTCTADSSRLQQALQVCQDMTIPLYQAFAQHLNQLTIHDTLQALPSFRTRRSHFLFSLFSQEENGFTPLFQSFLMDESDGLLKALWLWKQAEKHQQFEVLLKAIEALPQERAGVAYLLARLDQRTGLPSSAYADRHCQQLLTQSHLEESCLITLHQIYSLIQDIPALAQVAERFLQGDPYLAGALEMARFAYDRLGERQRVSELDQQLQALDDIANLLQVLHEPQGQLQPALEQAEALPPDQRHLLARRILTRPASFRREAVRSALLLLLPQQDEEKGYLLVAGMKCLVSSEWKELFARLAKQVKQDFDTTFPLLCTFLLAEEPAQSDFLTELSLKGIKDETLHLLARYAHQERVFAFLMEALDRNDFVILRKEILGKLFIGYSDNVIIPRLNAEQVHHLLERCLRDAHQGSVVSTEANRVIFYFKHPAAEDLLIAALQRETEKDIKFSLYAAVRNVPTARARTVLVERLLQETSSHWEMANALHEIFDPALHQQAMELIERTGSVKGANNYAAALVEHIEQGPPLVDLVDLVLSWPSIAEADLPKLKYVLLEGAKAALLQQKTALATNAFLRASEIAQPAISNYRAARKSDWQNPFEQDQDLQRRMHDLLSGATETQQATLHQKSETARRQQKPLARVSDAELAIMAGADVCERLFKDAETKEIWFLDINGAFHYFDGYWVVDPPFELVVDPDIQSLLADVTETTWRLMFWTRNGNEFQELVQYQQRILFHRGINNGRWQTYGLIVPSEAAASTLMHRLHRHMDKRFIESTPWYVQRHGAVIRTYGRTMLGVMGKRWLRSKNTFPNEAQAIQAYEEMELRRLKKGIPLTCIEWMSAYKRPEDLMILDYLRTRISDYDMDVTWHMETLEELRNHLHKYNLADLLPDLDITIGSGVTEEEIQEVARTIEVPIPEELLVFWRHFGSASWRLGELGMRVLRPAEMVQRRSAYRALMTDAIQHQLSAVQRASSQERLEHSEALVETLHEIPVSIWSIAPTARDGKVFSHIDVQTPALGLHFGESLASVLCTRFLALLLQAITDAAPELRFVKYGLRRDPAALHRRFELSSGASAKCWEIVFDNSNCTLATHSGKIGTEGAYSFRSFETPQAVEKAYIEAIEKKSQEGYIEVTRS